MNALYPLAPQELFLPCEPDNAVVLNPGSAEAHLTTNSKEGVFWKHTEMT